MARGGGGARKVRPEGQNMRCVVQLLTGGGKGWACTHAAHSPSPPPHTHMHANFCKSHFCQKNSSTLFFSQAQHLPHPPLSKRTPTLPGGARRDVSVASRHVSLIRPGATEAQSDDTYEVDDCFGSELGTTEAYKRVLHPVARVVAGGVACHSAY
jgi:hypothetical protein